MTLAARFGQAPTGSRPYINVCPKLGRRISEPNERWQYMLSPKFEKGIASSSVYVTETMWGLRPNAGVY